MFTLNHVYFVTLSFYIRFFFLFWSESLESNLEIGYPFTPNKDVFFIIQCRCQNWERGVGTGVPANPQTLLRTSTCLDDALQSKSDPFLWLGTQSRNTGCILPSCCLVPCVLDCIPSLHFEDLGTFCGVQAGDLVACPSLCV